MKVKSALATLPLVLNSCGGDEEQSYGFTPNEIGQGIWVGAFSAGTISTSTSASGSVSSFEPTESKGIGLYTSDKRVFFYNEDDAILFTHDTPGIVQHNMYYSPDYYLNGNIQSTVSFDGNVYISTSVAGEYKGAINGNYVMLFDKKYFRGADLNRLAGDWSYTHDSVNWNLRILSNGSFTGTSSISTSCAITGEFFTVDTSKNEYGLQNVSLSNCTGYDGDYVGLAATVDTNSQNDTLIMAIYNSNNGFFLKPVKQP